jgi:hypothetical protein
MKNNGSNSPTLDMKLPMMIQGNFETNFSVKHMLKDVVIASRLARGFGIEFGATDASRHGLTEELRQGRGDEDYSSLFRQYFPAGGPLDRGETPRDDQPQLAMDEVKHPETANPVVDLTTTPGADLKTEDATKEPSSDLVAIPAVSPPANDVEVGARAKVEEQHEVAPAAVLSEVANGSNEPAFSLRSVPESAAKSPGDSAGASTGTAASSITEDKGEEPRGLWGGFWKRRTDN